MRPWLLLILLLPAGRMHGGEAWALTATVQADFLQVKAADFTVSNKKTYLHILWDAFPYAKQLSERSVGAKQDLALVRKGVLEALLKPLLKATGSGTKNFKADIVEFSQRDDYGVPKWSSLKQLEHYEGSLGQDGSLVWNKPK